MEAHHYGYLVEQLVPCAPRWESIATNLRFQSHEIESIQSNMMPEACLRKVLSQWMQWAPGDARGSVDRATLEALKTAVDKAGYGKIAEGLTLSERREP